MPNDSIKKILQLRIFANLVSDITTADHGSATPCSGFLIELFNIAVIEHTALRYAEETPTTFRPIWDNYIIESTVSCFIRTRAENLRHLDEEMT